MFGQTFSEDLGRIGQFVKESHSKIKIRLTSAIGGISTCRSGVELLEKYFQVIMDGALNRFAPSGGTIGEKPAKTPIWRLWEYFSNDT